MSLPTEVQEDVWPRGFYKYLFSLFIYENAQDTSSL